MTAQEGFFEERAASVYDERTAEMFDSTVVRPVVQLLADLAGRGRALEFGIGTAGLRCRSPSTACG